MKKVLIAKRYAMAALDYLTPDKYETVLKEVKILRRVFEEDPGILKFLSAAIIKKHPKTNLYYHLTANFQNVDFWFELFKVINGKKRNNIVLQFFREFEHLIYKKLNYTYVRIYTTHHHDSETLKQIQSYVESILKTKTVYSTYIDKSLMGGFVAKTKEKTIDASVKHNLKLFKRNLVTDTYPLPLTDNREQVTGNR
jgi:ATP synthase F1 delta subunit